ncbi:glycerophosphodiester phosphodiesterase family protein [Bacteroides sp.]
MKMRNVLLASALLLSTCNVMAQTQVIAHRGYWKTEGSAQNSIASLLKADSIGCYGSEFDVWLTADDKLVVNHDPIFKLKSMERSTAANLTSLKLDNGEYLPTLEQYFKAAQKTKLRLILELKELSKPERETKAVEKIVAMAKKFGLENRMEYITFSLHATKEFIRLAPAGTPVFYLNGDLTPKELKEIGCAGPDYHLSVFKKHPEWIKESHDLGMKVNVWTVNKEKDMKWLIEKKVDFITTNEPERGLLLSPLPNPLR